MNPLGPRPAPPPIIGNVSHRPSSLFRKFSHHMSQWSKAHSTHQDHIMHPLDRADAIVAAALYTHTPAHSQFKTWSNNSWLTSCTATLPPRGPSKLGHTTGRPII